MCDSSVGCCNVRINESATTRRDVVLDMVVVVDDGDGDDGINARSDTDRIFWRKKNGA